MKILCFGSSALSRLIPLCQLSFPSVRFGEYCAALKLQLAVGMVGLGLLAVCVGELPAQTTIPVDGGQVTVHGARDRLGASLPQQNAKVDRRLLSVIEGVRRFGLPVAPPARQSHPVQILAADAQGRIRSYVKLSEWSDQNLAALETVGAFKIDVANQSLKTVLGSIPSGQIEAVEELSFVEKVTPPRWGYSRVGSQNTQGDAIHMANTVRTNLGLTGSGVKIGIISDGFNGLATAQGTADLPAGVTTFGTSVGGEGVAMAEIVHDLAPGAQLAIGAGLTDLEFIQRVTDLKNTFGAKIIVDDIFFPLEPYFEDGPVAQAYQMALNAGITMVSSAGNEAQFHYQKLFDCTGTPFQNGGSSFPRHRFNTPSFPDRPEMLRFRIPDQAFVLFVLQWTNQFGSSADDYDICFGAGSGLALISDLCSGAIQDGNDNPIDEIVLECDADPGSDYCFLNLQIIKFGGAVQTIEFFFVGLSSADILDPNEIIPGDSIVGHAALSGVISTAAINANDPGNDDIAPYSSRGPSTIRFPASSVRATPSITGIDNVTVSNAWGGPVPFPGTSAAAPHLAGIAALMLQVNPALTPSEVKATLQSTASDRGSAGFDNTYGAGLANALAAVNSVAVPDLIVTALTAPNIGTPGGTVTVSATVRNEGGAAAGPFQVAFYFSVNGTLDGGDARSATTCSYGGLGAGVTNSAGCSGIAVNVPGALTPGSYTLFAKVDDLDAVAESNEGNNQRASSSGPITVGEPGSVSQNGFESGALLPWKVFGGATAQAKAGAARTGAFGVEISGGGGFAGLYQDISGLTPGQNYEVGAWVRSPAGSGAASLWVHDTTGGNAVPLLAAPGAATYRRIKVDYRANGTGKMRIHLAYNGAPGKAEWDDIVVQAKNAIEFGFESGALAPWKKFGATSTTATAGAARTGSFGMEMSGVAGGLFFDLSDLTPGVTYEASVWVRGGGGTAYLWLHDTTGSNWATTTGVTTGAYQQIKVNYTGNATGKARIHLRVDGGPGSIDWDDVSFRPL